MEIWSEDMKNRAAPTREENKMAEKFNAAVKKKLRGETFDLKEICEEVFGKYNHEIIKVWDLSVPVAEGIQSLSAGYLITFNGSNISVHASKKAESSLYEVTLAKAVPGIERNFEPKK